MSHTVTSSHDPVRLLRIAYRAAAAVVRNPVLAEEASEIAVHRLQLALLAGRAPERPEAWVRTVARRTACASLRHFWARVQPFAPDSDDTIAGDRERLGHAAGDRLRAILLAALTPRQRDALDAALSCRSTRDAARTCGMQPRDFRRQLAAIARRARAELDELVADPRRRAGVLETLCAG